MVRPRSPRARDPYGIGPVGSALGPILSAIGLALVAVITFNLLNGDLPLGSGGPGPGNGGDGPARTAAPSGVVVVPDEAAFEGSIVYAKGGNIWIQSDRDVRQLTDSEGNIMPSWSADGEWIVYVHTHDEIGLWPVRGRNGRYDIEVPDLMRVKADGSEPPELLATGFFKQGRLSWSSWMRQPVLSPDGTTIALVTDAPDPDESNVVLQFLDLETKELRRAGVREIEVLGHQDPEWRPDGRLLLYTQNGRDGSRGAPVVMRYDTREGKSRALTAAGYMQPSYSPDGRYFAATRTTTRGTDVAILDANNGQELLRVTRDDASWAPVWSPAGDAIAFLHIVGQTVDLRLAKLDGSAPTWTVGEIVDLTEVSGLDAGSRPDWFIPPELLPTPPPTAPPSATPSGTVPSPAASPS
jgi:dipeptidyl aminopeptidase/acylaminoacyl peptidase